MVMTSVERVKFLGRLAAIFLSAFTRRSWLQWAYLTTMYMTIIYKND